MAQLSSYVLHASKARYFRRAANSWLFLLTFKRCQEPVSRGALLNHIHERGDLES